MDNPSHKNTKTKLIISAVSEYYLETNKARIAHYKKRTLATAMVNNAIKKGLLHRSVCAVCGDAKVQGHHEDYDKPLDVVWLCKYHHTERHKEKNKNGEGYLKRFAEAYAERERRIAEANQIGK